MRRPPPSRWEPRGFNLDPIWVIIAINLAVFVAGRVAGIVSPTYRYFVVSLLGLMPDVFLAHPWTIVTNMFVHAEFGHIIGNMLTLYFFGTFLERLVGEKKFLLVYFGGGLLGNVLYILLGEPFSVAIGASGAVYAVAGALVMMTPNLTVHLYFLLPMPLWVVVLVFFGLWSVPNFVPGVAWQAHLGGLVFGLAAGYYFKRRGGYYY